MKNGVNLGHSWVRNTIKRANNTTRELAEENGFRRYRLSCFFTVISVIQSNTSHFAGGCDWSHDFALTIVSFFTEQTWKANFYFLVT